MKIEIDTSRWISPRAHARLQDAYFWFLAARKAFAAVGSAIKTERDLLQAEVRFAEAFATTPLLEWDRIKGFTRGGVKVSDEEILADPDYAHFVECRDRSPKLDNRYH